MGRRQPEVPNDPEPREGLQEVVRKIDLPPEPPLVRRCLEVVMVVVPALPTGDKSEDHTVPAIVTRPVAYFPEHVRQRVDEERAVKQKHRRKEEAPEESVPAPYQPNRNSIEGRGHEKILIEPTKLRIPSEVLNVFHIRIRRPLAQDPAALRPPETLLLRRV